ncbi:hypothetical protein EUX98_g6798 [Antrodiella citrinella]|uniref:SH3 domain-containing protein n=1 Tax=Antrodiella citrinella TaxID=2447956 RepID=A0A4S4MND4_9APHY|nr:hypothetical protein EUX98_g6798 [Antrodiella citrinella]
MAESALLAHIVSQTKANVTFLAAHNHISQADATNMLGRLDAVESRGISSPQAALASTMQSLSVNNPREVAAVTPPPVRREVPTPPSRLQKAKALWAYNEDGQEVNDLSFSPGEIVEIVDETNADWWTGKCRGKQGLFPSNHVEKIASSNSIPPPAASHAVHAPPPSSYASPSWTSGPPMPSMTMPSQPSYSSYNNEKSAPYPPYGAPAPPGPGYGGPNYGGPQQVIEVQESKKKKKFGGDLGKTMANSAAGGVGFGAGAAIGSGIIDAIF